MALVSMTIFFINLYSFNMNSYEYFPHKYSYVLYLAYIYYLHLYDFMISNNTHKKIQWDKLMFDKNIKMTICSCVVTKGNSA
jgi:hypothetical protein